MQIPAEQALVIAANGQEELILSLQIFDAEPGAAIILPVPSAPTVSQLSDDTIFRDLAAFSQPREQIEERLIWRNSAGQGSATPESSAMDGPSANISGYSIEQLAAHDIAALQHWLEQHGHSLPPSAEPILRAYADAGWSFVAVRLADAAQNEGALRPLRLVFDSDQIVYPMRFGQLAAQPLDVQLYVLADHRVEIPGMQTLFADTAGSITRTAGSSLAEQIATPYLTRLRNSALAPTGLDRDFIARPAASDTPMRASQTRIVYVDGWSRMAGPIAGLVLAIISSSVALGIAFNIRRRIDLLAGPPPEEEDA